MEYTAAKSRDPDTLKLDSVISRFQEMRAQFKIAEKDEESAAARAGGGA